MKLTCVCAVLVLLASLAGCATPGAVQPQQKFEHVSFSAAPLPGSLGPVFIFFDHETGNLWCVANPEEPPRLIGRLESFDKPLNPKPAK